MNNMWADICLILFGLALAFVIRFGPILIAILIDDKNNN